MKYIIKYLSNINPKYNPNYYSYREETDSCTVIRDLIGAIIISILAIFAMVIVCGLVLFTIIFTTYSVLYYIFFTFGFYSFFGVMDVIMNMDLYYIGYLLYQGIGLGIILYLIVQMIRKEIQTESESKQSSGVYELYRSFKDKTCYKINLREYEND